MKLLINNKQTQTEYYWILFIFGVLVQLFYIGYSFYFFRVGFPLDDSWIHQTYAKNIMQYGSWVFNHGEPSAGSTSPLWTILLTPGHLLSNNFYLIWTWFVSSLLLIASSIIFQKIADNLTHKTKLPWAGFLFLLEWHIVWASNSGMETILFIFLILTIFYLLFFQLEEKFLLVCFLIGLIVVVRPDGITLVGPFFFLLVLNQQKFQNKFGIRHLFGILVFFAILLLYGLFNYALSGQILPNTFFAKQTEYQILYTKPLLFRFFDLFLIPITGVGILLLPGFFKLLIRSLIEKNWNLISVYLWFFGYVLIYAIRLPVTYQHGRYLIPTIPVFLILSFIGTYQFLQHPTFKNNLFQFGYKASIIAVLLIFFFIGGKVFAEDVTIIETEMVDTAIWIEKNIEKNAIIAAHDIGALGFFADKKIIDLAGLISPEVIPFIRNEQKLIDYLNQKNVDYLVTFPGWYEELDRSKDLLYQSISEYSPNAGGENMHIYIWE